MKVSHHRLIGLNTLMVMEIIQKNKLTIPDNIDLNRPLKLLGRDQKGNRKQFKKYLGAPDLIFDVYMEMPFGMDDRYEFYGHGLSAFQHFVKPDNGKYRGYNWDYDDSLNGVEVAGDVLMSLFSTDVKYDSTIEEYGFASKIMVNSPMNSLVHDKGGNVDLDDFEFPNAAKVGGYYGDKVARDNNKPEITRICAAGFSLHFVMDACCAHHVKGCLLNGHSEWETLLESNWRRRFDTPKDQGRLNKKFEQITKEVLEEYLTQNLANLKSVKEVIESNVQFIDNWLNKGNDEMAMKGKINRKQTKKICNRAVASCVAALNIML